MADGCTTHPVGYVEGRYVDPDVRRQGVGRALVGAAEVWAVSRGCREMASDARLDNAAGIAAHRALGFQDETPAARFRKNRGRGRCDPAAAPVSLPANPKTLPRAA
jgi:aminoglycoside 6'-N-acetyltransferase I